MIKNNEFIFSLVDKFVNLGLSTQPLNQPKAIEAVNLAYQCAKLDKPKEIIFVKSPMVGIYLINKLNKYRERIYPINAGHDFINLARYYTFRLLGLIEAESLAGLFALTEECGWVWTFENLCIVSERPTSLVLDEQGKLHNLKGPAITWSDGYCQYYVNGEFIQPNVGERLAWYLNNRKSSDQSKFSLQKELIKYQDLNLKIVEWVNYQIDHRVWNQIVNQVLNQVNQIEIQSYDQVGNYILNQVRYYVNIFYQTYNNIF